MQSLYKDRQYIKFIDTIVDIIFGLDILIMFRTSYRDPQSDLKIRDAKQIAINYIKGRFIIDLLASFPFDLILRFMKKYGDG